MYRVRKFDQIHEADVTILKEKGYLVTEDTSVDAYLVSNELIDRESITGDLKAIARAGADVSQLPIDVCTEKGIVVFHTPSAGANAVKELVFAVLLTICRPIQQSAAFAKSADYEELVLTQKQQQFCGIELAGKTLGVIGLGAVGSLVANQAIQFGMPVIGYDPYISVETAWRIDSGVKRTETLQELFAASDFISVHVPNMVTTEHLLDDSLQQVSHHIRALLNFSHSTLVSREIVLQALKQGTLAQYVSDSYDSLLKDEANVMLLPGMLNATKETQMANSRQAAQQLVDFLETGNITGSVNYPNTVMTFLSPTRLAVTHRNVTNMIGQMSTGLAHFGINIENIITKGKGRFAYTLIDIMEEDQQLLSQVVEHIQNVDGIISVRVLSHT